MSTAIANLVHQTTTGTGTGNLTLTTVNGKQSFNTAFGNGVTTDVFEYFISSRDAAEWERGTGHMSSSTVFVRDTVIESSNSNAAVSFTAGTKDVTCDLPAAKQARLDIGNTFVGNQAITGTLGVSSDFAVATNKFTVAAASGNTAVAGTLDVSGILSSIAHTVTSASATALAVGRLGTTTPALQVDASTGTSITGVKIKSAASGGGVAISAIGETNVALKLDAAGSGTVTINGTGTGAISLARNTSVTGTLGVSSDFAVNTDKFTVAGSSGNTAIAGDFAIATNKFTVAAASGNTVVAGTLAVTGAATFSSTLQATGQITVNKAAATDYNIIAGTKGGLTRWHIRPGEGGVAESGSNAGSNFAIYGYDDAGNFLNAPFSIVRSTGAITLGYDATVGGALSVTGAITATAGQIAFPATQSASAGANTLDDYEEGTWTPALAFGGGTTGITYSVQVGRYQKVGNRVHLQAAITLSNKGSSTGAATITGLPFGIVNVSNAHPVPSIYMGTMVSTKQWMPIGSAGTSTILLRYSTGGAATDLADTDFNNTSFLHLSMTYEVLN